MMINNENKLSRNKERTIERKNKMNRRLLTLLNSIKEATKTKNISKT